MILRSKAGALYHWSRRERPLLPSRSPNNFLMLYQNNMVTYESICVVSACVSWNCPFHNVIGPVISALFTRNRAVVIPSEQTAWRTAYVLDTALGALLRCEYSRDLVQTIVCLPAVADKLISRLDISQHCDFECRPEIRSYIRFRVYEVKRKKDREGKKMDMEEG